MLLSLEALPALEGDCLLLHWGSVDRPKLAVIDGGPGQTYEKSLRPRLLEIRDNRGLEQLDIDLVMVSHVDNDHIVGIKKFFAALRKEQENQLPEADRPFKVERLWHNTFNDILNDDIDDFYKTLTASVGASVGGEPNPAMIKDIEDELAKGSTPADEVEDLAFDITKVLAGHGESRTLRDDHEFLHDNQRIKQLNAPFLKGGKPTLITLSRTPEPKKVEKLSFKVIGPLDEDIEALQVAFDTFIEEKGLTVEAMLAAYADKSVPNLSSIVFIVQSGTKRILLTGDARGDKIIEGLAEAGVDDLDFDVLKVPHHGSEHNVRLDFFEQITAKTYIFSANGRFGNPDRATLEMLIEARGKAAKYNIVLTYPVGKLDERREQDIDDWDADTHSLAALFADCKDKGFKFKVIDDNPLIELGDEAIAW